MRTGVERKYVSQADRCPVRVGEKSIPYSIISILDNMEMIGWLCIHWGADW